MTDISRRAAIGAGIAATTLPRFAIAQADQRPVITVAVQKISNTNTLEPLREQSNVGERVLTTSIWEGLLGRNYQSRLETTPYLATETRRISDSVVEIKLRPGVKFHNGDELTAEDVAFSFGNERMFGPNGPASGETLRVGETVPAGRGGKELPPEVPAVANRSFPGFVRFEIVDRHTLRWINRTPDVTLEGRMTHSAAPIGSQRGFAGAATWLDWARKPVTTGPYKVAEFRADQSLTLVAHDEYWGGRPPIRQLRFVEVPEVSSRVNGLLSGEYQFACDIPPDQIVSIERNRAFEVVGGTIPNHRLTVFDKSHAILRNPLVRRAMTHAIDRQAIVDSLWSGRTVIPAGLQWEFYGDMFIADWRVPAFDLAEARRLLREANYRGEPIPYRLLNNYYTNQTPTAQILVEMWRAAGLNVQIEMKENWAQILEQTPTRAVRDWSNSGLFSDPVSSLVNQHGPNGQQQQVGEYANAEFNTLCRELETSTDRARRRVAFQRMLTIAEREDPAYTVLHQNATFTAKRRDIRWQTAPAFAMDFRAHNFGS
ncbi:ABC transporter substrate-binding protein [Plastoroseomonas arctica]|uniref:ABC transporter substrate-binding protein n=1 Tax=Plastoroseomonas arctica TaxID=1509237 RepID=A0AAF1JWX8_9PROT|nr:ABC transporter substrate-binding protein [Plastoroseomonas arctica]MBR0655639.1 ABC transporter substrate-binding protein [Plastoroseomonas arctica]